MLYSEKFNTTLLAIAMLCTAILPIFHFVQTPAFHEFFAVEDGPVEWGTAICLFVSFTVLARYALGFRRTGQNAAMVAMGFYALLFFFASGEELSWGQRIFGWEASEFFTENSNRAETNLHNLKVGEVKLVKVLFGNILTSILLVYLVILPIVYPRVERVRRLADRLAIPVPHLKHGLIALVGSIVVASVDLQRRWEVYEFIFSLVALSIFLMPQNANAFPGSRTASRRT
ncbi:hypothetical protein PEL8287_01365 [Roseovarius litorisediminis]|uniref:Uncharacterized protein n=1 Tax=Roseovarius litorisediminis TaxID=1312363 RepID=A0A1Y5S4D0_9RHOB|nr:hypothetical protein [Roseovarius litorisediminis]SLN29759.1 hypothetical protein PEL8287_01365 [Roseovarius litorisediminis]